MKIKRKGDKIIIELDYWQKENQPFKIHKYCGVIAGDEITISNVIYLPHKNDCQIGEPVFHFEGTEKEFKRFCRKVGLVVHEYKKCFECGDLIYGASTWIDKNKEICNLCYWKKEK